MKFSGRLLRPPRRLRFHRAGWIVSSSAVGLGVAAIATGNNLLFLVLGAMLGLIALSGGLSELALRGVSLERRVPRGVQAGRPAYLRYEIENVKRRLPSFALEIGERRHDARAFLPALAAGERATLRIERVWARRGVHLLDAVTVSTSFPFGLFQKERDLYRSDEILVWPRTDRPTREPRQGSERAHPSGELAAGLSGARGEYRSLRTYRPGDDPRDVHWRSSARSGEPVVREYAREQARTLWLVLDLRGSPEHPADDGAGDLPSEEVAVEIAAALAARAARLGEPLGLVTPDHHVEEGAGLRQLERVLDALAAARFRPDAPPPSPRVPPGECVLVAAAGSGIGGGWGDVYTAREAR